MNAAQPAQPEPGNYSDYIDAIRRAGYEESLKRASLSIPRRRQSEQTTKPREDARPPARSD